MRKYAATIAAAFIMISASACGGEEIDTDAYARHNELAEFVDTRVSQRDDDSPDSSIAGILNGYAVADEAWVTTIESGSRTYIKVHATTEDGQRVVMAIIGLYDHSIPKPGEFMGYSRYDSHAAGFYVDGCEGPDYDEWYVDLTAESAVIWTERDGPDVYLNFAADFGLDGNLSGYYLLN